MKQYLILCRSVTSAQRCAKLLEGALIRASVVKAPRGLSSSGCAYALQLHNKFDEAIGILKRHDMPVGKCFIREYSGEYREVKT